jgi:hypothetical protein
MQQVLLGTAGAAGPSVLSTGAAAVPPGQSNILQQLQHQQLLPWHNPSVAGHAHDVAVSGTAAQSGALPVLASATYGDEDGDVDNDDEDQELIELTQLLMGTAG